MRQATPPASAAETRQIPFDTANSRRPLFTMLVTMFSTQAMVSLGVVPSPESGKPEPNLPLAKHFIDLLGVLQEKTRRNLTGHESNLLEGSLHELRMAYIELSEAHRRRFISQRFLDRFIASHGKPTHRKS